MLRAALDTDVGFAEALWSDPAFAMLFQPPEEDEAAALVEAGNLLIWAPGGQPAGFAALRNWDAPGGVFWIQALAVQTPGSGQGQPFLAALLAHLFAERRAHRVGLDVTVDNAAARALYARAGFQTEGTLRECWLRPDGAHVDCLMLSLLRREWNPRNA
jgi:RimJ/RimL family protein N-acetyltransferase